MKRFQFIFRFICISITARMNETALKSSIAIIGAGAVGTALHAAMTGAGYRVVLGVRDAGAADSEILRARHGAASVAPIAEAAARADILLLTVPWNAVGDALQRAGNAAGKILIDVTNPIRMTPRGPGLAVGFDTSGAEQVQALAPKAHVFKTFNQTGHEVMRNPRAFTPTPVMFVAGDHPASKPLVLSLVRDIGFQAVDAGPLASARLLEPLAMVWIEQAMKLGRGRDFAFAFASRT
jgi:predicted dinucleotide-binding enzyme